MFRPTARFLNRTFVLFALVAAGCGGSSSPTAPTTITGAPTATTPAPTTPTTTPTTPTPPVVTPAPTTPTAPTNGSFSARIDGTLMTATTVASTFRDDGIYGVGGGNASMNIGIAWAGAATGSFSVTDRFATVSLLELSPVVRALSCTSGTINLTVLTATRIAGTFSLVCQELGGTVTRRVTDGAFDVTK